MYIEYYIIENLLINYIIISCTSILIKENNNVKKKWMGASLGAIYSVAYLYPSLHILFTIPLKIIIIILITLVSFSYKSKKEYTRTLLVFLLANIFISGSTYFVIYFTGIDHMKISFIIICAYLSCELLKYIYKDIKMIKYIKEFTKTITISLLNHSYTCKALLDSGNLLKDPISKSDIIIIKASILKDIIPNINFNYENNLIDAKKADEIINTLDDEISTRVRVIPYRHAGSNKTSMILGLKADYVEIDNRKIGNIVLGITNFNDEDYKAILNPTILLEA